MTASKRWRIVYPGCRDKDEFRSEPAAYEFVDALRSAWVAGGATSALTVQVDKGSGWQPYEHINFAEEAE